MALVEFTKLKQLFGDSSSGADSDLFREVFVLVLARATDADAYSHPAEIVEVQAVIKDTLGEDLSAGDIRTAALSKIYETVPLQRCITDAAPRLSADQRRTIVTSLVKVMHADDRISSREADFFNMVVDSLGLTAADAAGLIVE
jgi:uncharacterized tellurite resistance protein B-like protein